MDLSDSKTRRRVNKTLRERGVPAKVCCRCLVMKSFGSFGPRLNSPDGVNSACRSCATEKVREWRVSNPERQRESARQYARRFYAQNQDHMRAYRAERYRQDPETYRERGRSYRAANLDRVREADRERNKRWRTENPDKARAKELRRRAAESNATVEPFTARDLRRDWEDHDLYACFFCGGPLTDGYDVEHFYPLRPLGGSGVPQGPHAVWNLLPSCAPCNRGAGGKGTEEPWGYLRESLAEQGVDLDAAIAGLEAVAARRRP
ncbi:HNH endonuclease [Streptomyces sp. NPDC058960]|uniref:HNH endonuclease signature motif containing protein n=1 Tax=Streptomyces sp. NPDC058960 TaxID=3346679 RepID=UPI0036B3A8A0